jgi:hypothetical protein
MEEGMNALKRTATEYYDIDGAELQRMINDVGFTSTTEVARFFGRPDRLVRDWLDGIKSIPIAEVMVLLLMRHHNHTPDEVVSIAEFGP